MDDYLSKPVQFEELVAVLGRWLPAADEPAVASAPIDWTVLEKLRQFESPKRPNLVARLVSAFLEQTPGRIDAMRRALAERDWNRLATNAHDLKSESGNLGARPLSGLCDELQSAARAAEAESCAALVPRVAAAFDDARVGLAEAGAAGPGSEKSRAR